MTFRPLVAILVLAAVVARAQVDWRLGTPVELYQVRALASSPKLDGKLDDAAWQGVATVEQFYDYLAPTKLGSFPPLASIRTVMRIGSTAEGLWLGFDCYAEMDKVRADIVARDNSDIWREPCLELYFGDDWRHLNSRKFTINAIGTQADLRFRRGVLDEQWNDLAWRAATARHDDRWTAELFFPWESLGGKPERGNFLPLGVTRFSWTTGKIVGACWGAAMSNPYIYRSGQLLIEDDLTGKIQGLATIQKRWRGEPWHLWLDEHMVIVTSLETELDRVRNDARGVLRDIDFLAGVQPLPEADGKELAALRTTWQELAEATPDRNTWAATARLVETLRTFRDRLRVRQLLDETD